MYQMIQKCSIWRVFAEFAANPKKTYQIRELSREVKLAHTSILIYLKELQKDNLIKREKVGVYNAYIANFEEKKIDLDKYEKKLNRKIQMFFSENLSRLPKELQNNILNGIILSGFLRWKT